MGTPLHHHHYRPVPQRDFDDCDSEKMTHSITDSEKESKKTESAPCFNGLCNRLTVVLAIFLVLCVSVIVAMVTLYFEEGCVGNGFRGGGVGAAAETGAEVGAETGGGEVGLVARSEGGGAEGETKKVYHKNGGGKFPYQNIRLPRHFMPTKYIIHMHPNLTRHTFEGVVHISGRVMGERNYLIFHAGNNLEDLTVAVFSQTSQSAIEVGEITRSETGLDMTYVEVPGGLRKGEEVQMSIGFKAKLEAGLDGFYRSSYEKPDGSIQWIATTHFEPTYARKAFPCLDEPDMKATFQLIIVREPHHTALFNMPSMRSDVTKSGIVRERFQQTLKMSTYLVAFVVCDFENKTKIARRDNGQDLVVSVWAPAHQINQTDFALDMAVHTIVNYEGFFYVPFPLPKMDLIAVPDFVAGAMENWGLITYRMSALLYLPNQSSKNQRQWVATVVAHELAHQWFGNLVTMKWWNDLWLNEGFASYVELIGVNASYPDWRVMEQAMVHSTFSAMHRDSLAATHPISVTVQDPSQISQIFDAISYDKGSAVLKMLSQYLGSDAMSSGLRTYLMAHKFSNAETDDLWKALSDASKGAICKPFDVKSVMDTWTLQGGYPVLQMKKLSRNKYQLMQKRFLVDPRVKPKVKSPFNYKWKIPIMYATSDDPLKVQRELMTGEEMTLDLQHPVSWVKINAGQNGFFRVNYDHEGWEMMRFNLNRGVLSPSDRAGVLDDAFMLARAGMLDVDTALSISEYLKNETDYVPWKAGLGGLGYLMHIFEEQKVWPQLQSYLLHLLQPTLERLGWNDQDNLLDIYLRNAALRLAAFLGHDATKKEAIKKYKEYMRTYVNTINGDLRAVVYSTAIQYGDTDAWTFAFDRFSETQIPSERRILMSSLTKTTNPNNINKLLNLCLDSTVIKPQDASSVIEHFGHTIAGKEKAWKFLKKNYDALSKMYPPGDSNLNKMLKGVTSRFVTKVELDDFLNFGVSKKLSVGQEIKERIESDIHWLEKNTATVENWLEVHGFPSFSKRRWYRKRTRTG